MTDFDRAIKELQLGNYSEGMVILQELLKHDPENIDILYNLGICYSEMGLLKKSIETLERCTQLAPTFDNALVALGFSYFQSGSNEKAMAMFDKALEIDPENVYALKNKGALKNKSGKGGRNQHLALLLLNKIQNWSPPQELDFEFVAVGTDGEDGPTDAAGAIVNRSIIERASSQNLCPDEYIAQNNAYPFFEQIGGLIKTGPTHTNVCDIRILIISDPSN